MLSRAAGGMSMLILPLAQSTGRARIVKAGEATDITRCG